MIAADLEPGIRFTLPDGTEHTAVEVNRLSHRISVSTIVGTWLTLFPSVAVTTFPPTSEPRPGSAVRTGPG